MKKKLHKIRKPIYKTTRSVMVHNTLLLALLGIALGVLAKYLDGLALTDAVWWQKVILKLDLVNVFSQLPVWLVLALAVAVFSQSPLRAGLNSFVFLLGMCLAFHVYPVVVAGADFHLNRDMMIWYVITAAAPLLGTICWYGRGPTTVSILIDVLIFTVLTATCFSVGWIFIRLNGAVNAALFVLAAIMLFQRPRQILIGLLGGVELGIALTPLLPFSL